VYRFDEAQDVANIYAELMVVGWDSFQLAISTF
jgi:hypothetical protein